MAAQTGSAAEPNACERLSRRDAPVFDGEAALALCTAELGAACTYRTLAARARGCARQSLARLAEGKCREARRLAAVYFMMTGTKPCPKRSAAPCVRSLSEALRRACCEERCAAELYRRYAARGGEYASLLGGMAERAEQNAQTLLCVLQSVLCV